jgi:hypothetical protein
MVVSLWSPLFTPNSSPSQVRFDLDEPKLRLLWTDSPKVSPLCIRIGPSPFLGVMLRIQRACISLAHSLKKVPPSPSNAGLLELLPNFIDSVRRF